MAGSDPDGIFYGSDYFDKCYEFAVELIKKGKSLRMRSIRGRAARNARHPHRARHGKPLPQPLAGGNLALFERMKNGEFPDGYCTLRAKIDMSSPNMNMRDPAIYRIVHTAHHRQGQQMVHIPAV